MHRRISRWLRTGGIISALVISLVMVLSGTVHAITNGQPDENQHPYVCVVVMIDEFMNFVGSGSGILISPNVVLTSGHVTDAGAHAYVTFATEITPGDLSGYIYGVVASPSRYY